MKTNPTPNPQNSDTQNQPLAQVLGQSEHVKELVDAAAQELSSVSTALREEVAERRSLPGIENALEKTETAEDKVQDAGIKLSHMNVALKEAVRERHVLEFRLAAVTKRAEASRNAAFHDLLTGLPNRALFNDRLEHGLAQAKRHERNLAVMFIDLDDFKKINDTHGHHAGDEVLKIISARLKASTRDDDTVSRHGGDEFLYLLTEVESEQDLTLVAEKLIASIQLPCSVNVENNQISLNTSASVGIAIFPKDGTTAEALVNSADRAMYRAKSSDIRYSFAQ